MDQIHLSPLVNQIQLALGHISNSPEAPHNRRQLLESFLTRLVQSVENPGLEAL
jgi:hypothetical protein